MRGLAVSLGRRGGFAARFRLEPHSAVSVSAVSVSAVSRSVHALCIYDGSPRRQEPPMRSRATARRTPPPEPSRAPEVVEPRTRPTARATPPASRRARREPAREPVEPSALEAVAPPPPADPGELYRREKSRRVSRVDPAVMAEARRLLEEAMTPIGGRKKGGTLTVGQAARRRKPALKPDEFDLPEYRPGSGAARGGAEGEEE